MELLCTDGVTMFPVSKISSLADRRVILSLGGGGGLGSKISVKMEFQ